jgi:hypothetical protein
MLMLKIYFQKMYIFFKNFKNVQEKGRKVLDSYLILEHIFFNEYRMLPITLPFCMGGLFQILLHYLETRWMGNPTVGSGVMPPSFAAAH